MRILLVVHGYPPLASAGTEVYVHALAHALTADGRDEVAVLTRDADPCRPEYDVRHEMSGRVRVVRVNNTFQQCHSFSSTYLNPEFLRVAMAEVAEIRPDVAHIHHLTCLSTGLPEALAARGCPVVMTLHDYWMICHRGQLFDANGTRCDGPFENGCASCLPPGVLAAPTVYRAGRIARALPIPGAQTLARFGTAVLESATPAERTRAATMERLAHMQAAARHVQMFLAPSSTAEDLFRRFGIGPDRLRRCELGIDLAPFQSIRREPSSILRLGFAGGLLPSKAPHLLIDAAAKVPSGSVCVDVLGSGSAFHGDDSYVRHMAALLARPFVRRVGFVPHERMPEAFAAVDAVVVPSVWIENAPLTIREAFASGAPVIASNLGGMREMIAHERNGLLFEPGSPESLAAAIRRLIDEPDLLARLRVGITPPLSIHRDAESLRHLYADVAMRSKIASARVPQRRNDPAPRTCAIVLNYQTPDQTWLTVRSLQTSLVPVDQILVVDNGSRDGSSAFVRERLPDIDLLETTRNLGFSGGCNAGICRALDRGAEAVLLVNSDAVLRPDAVGALLGAAGDCPDAGVLGALIVSREEPDHVASAGLTFSERTGRMRHRDAGARIAHVAPSHPHDVTAISGCVMWIRADVFRRIGLLDEEYFYSFEDLDFCMRARRAGFRVMLVPAAIAYHEGGRSIGRRSPDRVYFATRNHLKLARSTLAGTGVSHAARGALIVGMNAAYAVLSPQVPLVSGLAAVVRGACDHLRGRYGAGPVA
jgi:GT2 family glycosyltransferase/glycosyltransferase involved in cell wall biosynthesis